MHPYLAEQLAAAHRADLHREAAATCCHSLVRRRLRERFGLAARVAAPQPCCG